MSRIANKAAKTAAAPEPQQTQLSNEDKSKDAFFVQVAALAEAMIAQHGKDFAIGTLVLSAKFIAEGKPLVNKADGSSSSAPSG